MKLPFFILITFCVSCLAPTVHAFDTTYYLVRHAEKQSDGTHDPALTEAGVARAQKIAKVLKGVKLNAIYSTDYKRTRSTAAPVAAQTGLEVVLYDPRQGAFETFIASLKELEGNILVVGHSNTTPVVAGVLSGQTLPELHEHQYDHMYIVTRKKGAEETLVIKYINPLTP